MNAKKIIQELKLIPHPEGGYYRETYRSDTLMQTNEGEERNVSTAIYFLLENDNRSRFHKIKSDEIWFFHQGKTVEILIAHNLELERILLGNDFSKGEVPQAMVPAGSWFASHLKEEEGVALVSCTVAPGFDFTDFEMATAEQIIELLPEETALINQFTL